MAIQRMRKDIVPTGDLVVILTGKLISTYCTRGLKFRILPPSF